MTHNPEKIKERKIVLKRLFYSDRDYYKIGKLVKNSWFDRSDEKFNKDVYAYFADEERKEAIEQISVKSTDADFVMSINKTYGEKERYLSVGTFVGQFYYFDTKMGLISDNRTNFLKEQTEKAINDTRQRGYYFLKALIDLHREGKWDKAYGGASWSDILAKTREIGGSYPSPRDLVMLKSYGIYFKTGSRRYPTHTLPEEMIPTVERVLVDVKRKMITAK